VASRLVFVDGYHDLFEQRSGGAIVSMGRRPLSLTPGMVIQ